MKQLTILLLCTAMIVGCGAADSNRNATSVAFDDGTVTFYDFRAVSELHEETFPMPAGESVYLFSFVGPRATIALSDGTAVRHTGTPGESCIKGLEAEQYLNKALFNECLSKIQNAQLKLNRTSRPGFDRLVSLGERAVKAEGSCTWIGYDRQLDRTFRAVGALIPSNDPRLFFARLRCK